jgi:hypothetical protein
VIAARVHPVGAHAAHRQERQVRVGGRGAMPAVLPATLAPALQEVEIASARVLPTSNLSHIGTRV